SQPFARRDLRRRWQERRDGFRHALVLFHHVIGRDLRHLLGRTRFQRMRFVSFPIGAFVMIVRTEKCVESLRRMKHVVVGAARALIVLVILPWRIQLRQLRVELIVGESTSRGGRAVRRVERQRWWAFERGTQNRYRAENVWPDQ